MTRSYLDEDVHITNNWCYVVVYYNITVPPEQFLYNVHLNYFYFEDRRMESCCVLVVLVPLDTGVREKNIYKVL